MKKEYTKPVIEFHTLALSSEISSSCTYQASFQVGACPIAIPEFGGETVFTEDVCVFSNDDFPCYDVPLANSNVFES